MQIIPILLTIIATAINIPGMLEGKPLAIGGGLFCAAVFGFVIALKVMSSTGHG